MRFLDENWKEIASKHYSTLAFYVICVLILVPEAIYLLFGVDLNPIIVGRWLIAAALFGLIGKFLIQTDEGKWVRRVVIGFVVIVSAWASFPALAAHNDDPADVAAYNLIAKWEGKRNQSYKDIVGVWTVCYGHTRTAGPGQYKTDFECRRLLIQEIAAYRTGLYAYLSNNTKRYRLPAARDAAYVSLAYNVGVRAAGRSTAIRRLNGGNISGGCDALTWWNKAGGRVVRGLVRRRSEERAYCLRGL